MRPFRRRHLRHQRRHDKLASSGITREEAREALRTTHGGWIGGSHVVDSDRARLVVAAATRSMLDAIHTLTLITAVVPIAAIVVAIVLIKPTAPR